MQIQSINNNNNFYTNFKGSVSPKFVQFVEGLRQDCLASVPKQSTNLINNVCDGILNRANRIMKTCFPDSYTLSIGKEESRGQEVISMENSVIKKYIPECSQTSVLNNIKSFSSPVKDLLILDRGIKGSNYCYIFSDGYGKSLIPIFNIIEMEASNLESYNKNKDMLNDFKGILEWWRNNINKLRAESTKDYQFENCEEQCDEVLSMIKQYENQ